MTEHVHEPAREMPGIDHRRLLEVWVREYSNELFGVALRDLRSREEAEDSLHDTIEKALKALPRCPYVDNPRAWLHTILRNTIRNRVRSFSRQPLMTDLDGREVASRYDDDAVWRRWEIGRVIALLPEDLRELLQLRYGDGYTDAEIADIVGKKIGTVKSGLYRSRRIIADALGDAY